MLDLRYDPLVDDVLRRHLLKAAERLHLSVNDLEDLLEDEEDALGFLKEVGEDAWREYVEDASRRVDHVGWIMVPATNMRRAAAAAARADARRERGDDVAPR